MDKQLQADVDAELIGIYNKIAVLQEAYIRARRQYWQGLMTHRIVPKDGVDSVPTEGSRTTVGDDNESWSEVRVLPVSMKLAMRVDVYEDIQGWGWTLTGLIESDGQIWSKTLNFGHLQDRETDWTPVVIDSYI